MPPLKTSKLRISELEHQSNLLTTDVGDYILINNQNLKRFQSDALGVQETEWLKQAGIGNDDPDNFFYNATRFFIFFSYLICSFFISLSSDLSRVPSLIAISNISLNATSASCVLIVFSDCFLLKKLLNIYFCDYLS